MLWQRGVNGAATNTCLSHRKHPVEQQQRGESLISCHWPPDVADGLTSPTGLLKCFSWTYRTLRYWILLAITEWLLRWLRFSWKPWLLKWSGYTWSSVSILKGKISSPRRCRKVLKMWHLRAPNTVSNAKKWNYILLNILLFYNQFCHSFFKFLTLYAQEWKYLLLDLRKVL